MPQYTYTFDTNNEGWRQHPTGSWWLAAGDAAGWTGGDGSPDVGCLTQTQSDFNFQFISPTTSFIVGVGTQIYWSIKPISGSLVDVNIGLDALVDGTPTGLDGFNALVNVWTERQVDVGSILSPGAEITKFRIFASNLFDVAGSMRADSIGLVATLARFYQGAGVLTERFTLPFTSVQPGGMTLNKTLGTVVVASSVPAGVVAVYSNHPYPTGTATDSGLPTGTAITSIKWI